MFPNKTYLIRRITNTVKYIIRRGVKKKHLSPTYDDAKVHLQKFLKLTDTDAENLLNKCRSIEKLSKNHINEVADVINEIKIDKSNIRGHPNLLQLLPITLKCRYNILSECGFKQVSAEYISSYLHLVKKKNIHDLKKNGLIDKSTDVKDELVKIFTGWPSSPPIRENLNENEISLFDIRMKVLQRYLELTLDITPDDFCKSVNVYPRLKHRPLRSVSDTLILLTSQLTMPIHKIRANFFLLHANPENIRLLLFKLKSIAGVNVKEILNMRPILCNTSYNTFIETGKVLKEYSISEEAQRRCFEIYTLSPDTVRHRLEEAKTIPEFEALFCSPRLLKIIYYSKRAKLRLQVLKELNKKCFSLNVLSGSSKHYEVFKKGSCDKSKGIDLLRSVCSSLGPAMRLELIRKEFGRHPHWVNVPVSQAKQTCEKLKNDFMSADIYLNCCILLYPWSKIEKYLNILQYYRSGNFDRKNFISAIEHLDCTALTNVQVLSLVQYVLEKEHYFTGNGIWYDQICDDLSESKHCL